MQMKSVFPYQRISPEEFVARRSHGIMTFSLDRYDHGDPEVNSWMQRVGALLRDAEATDRCRREWLTHEEYAAVQGALAMGFE